MKQISKAERKQIYLKMIDFYHELIKNIDDKSSFIRKRRKNNFRYYFICLNLWDKIQKRSNTFIDNKKIRLLFPEVYLFKAKYKDKKSGGWFKTDKQGFEERIMVLHFCVELCK